MVYIEELIVYRGERRGWTFVIQEGNGDFVDITGANIRFTVRLEYPIATLVDDTDGGVLLTKSVGSGISLSDAVNGEFEILMSKADTNTQEVNAGGKGYLYEISLVESGQSEPRIIANGPFILKSDIVRGD